MVKIRNVFGDELSGKAGKAGVYAKWKGRQYRRKYVIPANPRTPRQQSVRSSFTAAVDRFHTWNALQKMIYDALASGLVMSGFNLWISRYQKAVTSGAPAPQDPLYGFKQVASASTTVSSESTPASKGPNTLAHAPVARYTFAYTPGGTDPAAKAIVYCNRGAVYFPTAITGAVTIDYVVGGKAVTGKTVKTNPAQGDVVSLGDFDIDPSTVHVYVNGTEQQAVALNEKAGKYYFTKQAPASTGTCGYNYITPISGAKMEMAKAGSSKILLRLYSDDKGDLGVAATIEDEPYDYTLSASGYASVIKQSVGAAGITADEVIIMTSA
jgi:hypothetical protein